jgi:aspartyl-tRNA(Asn)/glutamyl-tRNA(Gln) amidotransferase subunit A
MSAALTGSIPALAPELRAGRLRSTAVVEAALDRIARLDPALQSFVCVAPDAMGMAAAADAELAAGRWRGPLHGIPVAVKDNHLTVDMPTMVGTAARGISFPRRDAGIVARLRTAGAVIIGKTTTHEFAWGVVTPPTRNPWDRSRIPGGSSGGSGAAVAAGLVRIAMGSDTGGSIRVPASLCGTVGLKPTFGRVGRVGIVPHSWSLDHGGPLTGSVAESAMVLAAIAGVDRADPSTRDVIVPDYLAAIGQPVRGLRIGICRNHFFDRNDPEVEAAVEAAIDYLSSQGVEVQAITLPNLPYALGAMFAIELSSSTAYHACSLASGVVAGYTPDVRLLVEMGRLVTGPDYLKAEQLRSRLIRDVAAVFQEVDAIVSPTMPLTAWTIGESTVTIGATSESVLGASWRLTYPWSLTGLPAISLPCGFDRRGLPIGLQIAGRPFDEVTILRLADAYERGHDWVTRTPAM